MEYRKFGKTDLTPSILGFGMMRLKRNEDGSINEQWAIDTLRYAIDNGLVDYVAMDIKNCPDKYAMTAGVRKLDIAKIEESVKILMTSGVDYEFRTTVTAELHSPEDFTKIGEWIKGAKRYYIQNFEYSGNTISVGSTSLDSQKLDYLLYAVLPYVPTAKIRS